MVEPDEGELGVGRKKSWEGGRKGWNGERIE